MSSYRRISHMQFFFLQSFASIGMISLRFPANLIGELNQHAWIVVLLALLVGIMNLYVAIRLTRRHPYENLADISKRYLGKWLGSCFILLMFLETFTWGITMFWENWAFTSYTQLRSTPVGIIAVLFMAVIWYLLSNGLEAWSRLVQLIGFFMLLSIPILNLPQLVNADFARLLPLSTVQWSHLGHSSSLHGLLMFKGSIVIYFLKPNVEDNRYLLRLSAAAMLLAFVQVLPSFVLPIVVFGSDLAAQFSFPYTETMETVPLYLLPIEKFSFTAPIFYLLNLSVAMMIAMYCSHQSLLTIIPSRYGKLIQVILILLAAFILMWPVSVDFIRWFYPSWSLAYGLIFVLAPLLMWIAGALSRKKVALHES